MSRLVGTISRGIRMPIIRQGDNLVDIVTNNIIEASNDDEWGWKIRDNDIIAITESIVARSQGNYATVDNIAQDVINKFGKNKTIGVVFPILSRNRFAICLEGIAKAAKRIIILLSFPTDEVGNELISKEIFKNSSISINDFLTLNDYRKIFGYTKHPFTGIDYVEYYKQVVEKSGAKCDIIFSNNARDIIDFTDNIICCDIHSLKNTMNDLQQFHDLSVYGIDQILNEPINDSGYNEKYGLLGSNKATDSSIKLFPRDSQYLVDDIQKKIYDLTGKHVEVLIYGDGAFKDPVGGIWELADPVVSPFYTSGLEGTPNELKIKYLADNFFSNLTGQELDKAITEAIKEKDNNLIGKMSSEGTTPRQLTDLIGSLSDLTSGSGDKGTPVVYIQGYFDNYSSN